MSKRTVAISRQQPRKIDFCHKMKSIKIVDNKSGWFNINWRRRDFLITEAHYGLRTTPRKSLQLITTEEICMSGGWGKQAPTPKWWQKSWVVPRGRPAPSCVVLHHWMLLGFTRPVTSSANPGELSVDSNHGHNHITLAFCQPGLITACKKPWAGKSESSLS